MFADRTGGYADGMGVNAENDETTKPGPANPQGSGDLDAPTPPGGPLRSDAPSGGMTPGGPGTPVQPGEPKEQDRPGRAVPEPHDGQELTEESLDLNAETAQGEPSDDSGHR